MLMKFGLGLLALLVVLLGVIATRPDAFEIKRSLRIDAPPEVIFSQLNDFHAWNAWSPWDKRDPNMKRTFSGAPSGVGHEYEWSGNKDVGQGKMTITEAVPAQHLGLDLEFITPFPAKNRTDFTLVKSGEGTTVTWAMSGKNTMMGKAMSLVMDMDKLVGPDFEAGLANLRRVSEAARAAPAPEAPSQPSDAPVQ
jgi:uncharacterized protein YndB with AHSA1/START domain